MLLLIFLLVLPLALVACDKTPEKYKMKNFYGTYDRFAYDYYTVLFYENGKQGTTDLTSGGGIFANSKKIRSFILTFRGRRKSKSVMLF